VRARVRQGYEASKNDQPIQVTPGVYNEVAMQRYDLLLAEAARNGIRLILSLSNWWDEQGGVRRAASPRARPARAAGMQAVPCMPWAQAGRGMCAHHGVWRGCCHHGCFVLFYPQCKCMMGVWRCHCLRPAGRCACAGSAVANALSWIRCAAGHRLGHTLTKFLSGPQVQWYVDQVLGDAKPKLGPRALLHRPGRTRGVQGARHAATCRPRGAALATAHRPQACRARSPSGPALNCRGAPANMRNLELLMPWLRPPDCMPPRRAHLPAQGYISTILLRNNTLVPGGLLYKDDPTVLAWELQNEPQLREGYEKCDAAAVPNRLQPQRCRLPVLLACSVLAHKGTARACAGFIAWLASPYKAHVCRL